MYVWLYACLYIHMQGYCYMMYMAILSIWPIWLYGLYGLYAYMRICMAVQSYTYRVTRLYTYMTMQLY